MTTPNQSPTPEQNNGVLPKGVCIILYRDGKFAVSQRLSKLRNPGLWQFAGGHVEAGETPIIAARRELKEETGLTIDEHRFVLLGEVGPLVGYSGEKYMGTRYGVILDRFEAPKHTEPEKHTPWIWVTPPELAAREMLQATREFALLFAWHIALGERNELAGWKQASLKIESWWQELSDYVRGHPDILVGDSIAKTAMAWLKERDALRVLLKQANDVIPLIGDAGPNEALLARIRDALK